MNSTSRICWSEHACRQLRRLDPTVARGLIEYVDGTECVPGTVAMAPKAEGEAFTVGPVSLWRYRCGPYRILASFEEEYVAILAVQAG